MLKKSPLAPKNIGKIKQIKGIDLYVYSAGLYNKKRLDLALFLFKNKTSVAEVFTKSSLRSCTLDWNEKNLKNKEIEALIVNSGNANTFTGQAGINALTKISNFVSNKFKVSVKKVFFASTGVIGEKFPENNKSLLNVDKYEVNKKVLSDDIKMMHECIEYKYFKKVMKRNNDIIE